MIKYKVWDKLDKKFIENNIFVSPKGYVNILRGPIGNSNLYDLNIGLNESDYEINQYIGVNDINGKEIYEGDILNCIESENEDDLNKKFIIDNNKIFFLKE